jgi:hypothetical protein
MEHYTELARYERDGFDIIVDMTNEYIHPRDLFDDSAEDIAEICRKIDDGTYEWFMLRVRALFGSHEFGVSHLGGCLYTDAREVLTDGMAEDLISETVELAKKEIVKMRERLEEFVI